MSPKFFFFYDPAGQLIGEYKDNTTTVTPTDDWIIRQETVWLDDIPIAIIKKPTPTSAIQIYYIHADHLNTPRVITNTSNTIIWRWENTHPFGANLPNEDPDGNGQLFEYSLRFPGQYFDKETGLHYNYFRYYEPETGRYISPDPIGLTGGLNVWGYVEQNPLIYTDPLGLRRTRSGKPHRLMTLAGSKAHEKYNQLPDNICDYWPAKCIPIIPSNKTFCRTICPDQGTCMAPPVNGVPSLTLSGCYMVCEKGSFISPY